MANADHIEMFKGGAAAWNEWRKNPAVVPDLSGASLYKGVVPPDVKLTGINLKGTNLVGANFSGLDLSDAELLNTNLTDVILNDAKLDRAKLARCKLCRTKLNKASLVKAELMAAEFCETELTETNLNGALLNGARFRKVVLTSTDFSNANLTAANFEGIRFGSVKLDDAILKDAWLKDADLRTVKGLTVDSTYLRGARFSPKADDKWSVLRRKYTGTNLLFNLILLVAFVVPYAARVMMWTGVNRAQESVKEMTGKLNSVAEALRNEGHPAAELLGEAVGRAAQVQPCLRPVCKEWSVWELLLGVDQGASYWLLAVALLLFNACRAVLTRNVGPLREEEERSGYAPAKAGYEWLYVLHRVVQVLFYVSVASFLWHGFNWLRAPVFLPAG